MFQRVVQSGARMLPADWRSDPRRRHIVSAAEGVRFPTSCINDGAEEAHRGAAIDTSHNSEAGVRRANIIVVKERAGTVNSPFSGPGNEGSTEGSLVHRVAPMKGVGGRTRTSLTGRKPWIYHSGCHGSEPGPADPRATGESSTVRSGALCSVL